MLPLTSRCPTRLRLVMETGGAPSCSSTSGEEASEARITVPSLPINVTSLATERLSNLETDVS
eukprot:3714088-Prymnesium_polylepis.1